MLALRGPAVTFRTDTSRYMILLGTMLLVFVTVPIMQEQVGHLEFLDEMMTALLIVNVYVVRKHQAAAVVAAFLALPGWVVSNFPVSHGWLMVGLASEFCFFMLTAGIMLSEVLADREVTRGTLAGALCVYFLMGVAFTYAFTLLDLVNPTAFHFTEGKPTTPNDLFMTLIYFSFTTLTTLGYGDVLPLGPTARSLSVLEAVLGQLYLAVLVARLVGMHGHRRTRRRVRPRRRARLEAVPPTAPETPPSPSSAA